MFTSFLNLAWVHISASKTCALVLCFRNRDLDQEPQVSYRATNIKLMKIINFFYYFSIVLKYLHAQYKSCLNLSTVMFNTCGSSTGVKSTTGISHQKKWRVKTRQTNFKDCFCSLSALKYLIKYAPENSFCNIKIWCHFCNIKIWCNF